MEITRDIFNNLKAWKDSMRRKPLVMQGARQYLFSLIVFAFLYKEHPQG